MTAHLISTVCRSLQIPAASAETIERLIEILPGTLEQAAESARDGSIPAQAQLRGVMLACHDRTIERLAARGLQPSLEALAQLGLAEGAKFGESVKEWADSGDNGDLARYVRLAIAREMSGGQADVRSFDPLSHRPGRQARVADRREAPAAPAPVATNTVPFQPRRARAQESEHRDQVRGNETHGNETHASEAPSRKAEDYLSQHIYGGRAAACFSADVTRGGTHTVRLEAAEASATRQYDWSGKIAIQLSQRELPLVLAVFMQWLPKFEGKGHGENNSKWFTLENQGNKLFLSVNAKGRSPRAVPIMPGDGYALTTLLIRQMLKNDPFLTPEILLSLVRKEATLAGGQAHPVARAA